MLRVVVLGAAAGGGVPQWNCGCPVCLKARSEHPELQSTQCSIAVSADGEHWFLINASPDLRQQVIATPQPGHTVAELQKVIDEEIQKLQHEPPTAHELQRSINQIEASFYNRMERVGGFGGKADQLNAYYTYTGNQDWFNEDLGRYRVLSADDVSAAAAQFLPLDKRVELTVEPEKKP